MAKKPKKHTKTIKGLLVLKSVKDGRLNLEMTPDLGKDGKPLPNEIIGSRQLEVPADFLPEGFDLMYDSVVGEFSFTMEAVAVTPRPQRKKR